MKVLICTEKPSVARQFAEALGVQGRQDGYIEDDNYIITWCVGHLIGMPYPEAYDPELKKWSFDTLPFLPDQYKYEVIPNVRDQYKVVARLLNREDISVIYNAGDSGREGEYIQRLVYQKAGWNKNAVMKRIWIDSQTDEAIKNGIKNAKAASCYDRLADAAYMRAIEDYAVGINLSRAFTLKYKYELKARLGEDRERNIAVGRVMTCVLGMIVERERAIRDFKITSFYRIEADTGFISAWKAVETSKYFNSPLLYNDTGFKKKEDAVKFLEFLKTNSQLAVYDVQSKIEKKKAPLLFNLAELQNECSKYFKISPDKTLSIAQKLYEAKLTTYPRTDARVISTAVAKEIVKNINGLLKFTYKTDAINYILNEKRYQGIESTQYCDDSKITDHYAIIPTGQGDIANLDEIEEKVFYLIIDRFLSIFYPPAEYNKIEAQLLHSSGEKFFVSERLLVKPGYLNVIGYKQQDIEKNNLAELKKGSSISAKFEIKEGQTSPPKRYTSGSLILAMENAGNLIEDEELRAQIKGSGIGTSATRAEVIKKLEKNEYIIVNNKTQIVTPHVVGEGIYDIVAETVPNLLSPKITASWEKGLSQIEHGEITKEKFKEILYEFVRKSVRTIESITDVRGDDFVQKVVCECPFCGGDVVTTRSGGFRCKNYCREEGEGCSFIFSKIAGRRMLKEELLDMVYKGQTKALGGFISKKDKTKTYSMRLILNRQERKIEFELAGGEETSYKCPKCRKRLIKSKYSLNCECGIKIPIFIAGKSLTDTQISKLMEEGKTDLIKGFKRKDGEKFNAYVVRDGATIGFKSPKKS